MQFQQAPSPDEYRYQHFSNYGSVSSSCEVEDKSGSSQCCTTHGVDPACAATTAPASTAGAGAAAFNCNRADVCSSLIAAGDVCWDRDGIISTSGRWTVQRTIYEVLRIRGVQGATLDANATVEAGSNSLDDGARAQTGEIGTPLAA